MSARSSSSRILLPGPAAYGNFLLQLVLDPASSHLLASVFGFRVLSKTCGCCDDEQCNIQSGCSGSSASASGIPSDSAARKCRRVHTTQRNASGKSFGRWSDGASSASGATFLQGARYYQSQWISNTQRHTNPGESEEADYRVPTLRQLKLHALPSAAGSRASHSRFGHGGLRRQQHDVYGSNPIRRQHHRQQWQLHGHVCKHHVDGARPRLRFFSSVRDVLVLDWKRNGERDLAVWNRSFCL